MSTWERYQDDEIVYDGHRKVVLKHFRNRDGKEFDFETFEKIGSESVVALVIDQDNQVVIAEQFRVGPEQLMMDCPGGALKKGQSPIEAAKDETLEETGHASDEWTYLGATHEHPYSNRLRHYCIALNAYKVSEPNIEDLEDIEVRKIPIDQLIENSKTGKMTDALIVLYALDILVKLMKKA